jgi:aminotransferase
MGFDCYEPQGAFYVFPSIKKFGMTSDEFALKLLEEEKVAVVPGTGFRRGLVGNDCRSRQAADYRI